MASILRFDNWQNSDGTSIATTDASGNISFAGSLGATAGVGKILQVVRATDSTQRNTTSTSFTDITGLSVTITPTSASSTILVVLSGAMILQSTTTGGSTQITDSSNVALSGAEAMEVQDVSANSLVSPVLVIGYDSPATTSAVTYKGRFRSKTGGGVSFINSINTAQIFALEVGA